EPLTLDDGTPVSALSVICPTKMQRAQRRLYLRADVPAGRVVRAAFWLGGVEAEPRLDTPETPVWSGRVSNISAGGVQISAEAALGDLFDTGDVFGMHVSFGPGEGAVHTEAQFRHAEWNGQRVLLGFQFVGLEHTPEGRKSLQFIGRRVGQFRRETEHQQRARRSRSASR
ncbi:MAG: PilZ domain-containing protein, partial [Planctomycetota bacterium]